MAISMCLELEKTFGVAKLNTVGKNNKRPSIRRVALGCDAPIVDGQLMDT